MYCRWRSFLVRPRSTRNVRTHCATAQAPSFSTAIGQSVPMTTWSAPSRSIAARITAGWIPIVSI